MQRSWYILQPFMDKGVYVDELHTGTADSFSQLQRLQFQRRLGPFGILG